MTRFWRLLAWLGACQLIAGPGVAFAQTVIVRGVAADASVEVFVNASAAGTARADGAGDARVTLDLTAATGKAETEVYVHVDGCGAMWRVLLVEAPVLPPPPEPGCERRDVAGLFVLRPVSTVIVNAAASAPTLLLRQGPVNLAQLGVPVTPPTGLMVFGGGGYGQFGKARNMACGSVADCAGSQFRSGLTAGVLYWITPSIGAEAAYVWPQPIKIAGTLEPRFDFDSSLDTRLFTLVGKLGGPAGRARIYGQGGLNYHEAVWATAERVQELTQTSDDGATAAVLPGGTWSSGTKTSGWGWTAGGGVEGWTSSRMAIYVEGGWLRLKGSAVGEGEAVLDDRLFYFRVGARLRIGG